MSSTTEGKRPASLVSDTLHTTGEQSTAHGRLFYFIFIHKFSRSVSSYQTGYSFGAVS